MENRALTRRRTVKNGGEAINGAADESEGGETIGDGRRIEGGRRIETATSDGNHDIAVLRGDVERPDALARVDLVPTGL